MFLAVPANGEFFWPSCGPPLRSDGTFLRFFLRVGGEAGGASPISTVRLAASVRLLWSMMFANAAGAIARVITAESARVPKSPFAGKLVMVLLPNVLLCFAISSPLCTLIVPRGGARTLPRRAKNPPRCARRGVPVSVGAMGGRRVVPGVDL